ncbi:MAG: hypothetical protein JSV00_10265, partial [bacterium]
GAPMLQNQIIDAAKELSLLRSLRTYNPPFEVIGTYRLIDDGERPEATVMLRTGDQEMHEADIGVGPVDALGKVLKKSLGRLFPDLVNVRLVDFGVRLLEGTIGTSAQVSVQVVFSDGNNLWRVSAADDNINLASFRALLDGYEYAIYLWGKEAAPPGKAAASPGKGRRGETGKQGKDKGVAGSAKAKGKAGGGSSAGKKAGSRSRA